MALIAIHPGEHLAEELKELDMSVSELARKLAVPTNRITGRFIAAIAESS
jgi:antitoxin HigA-1